jgi:hypothetical protein
MTEEDLRKQAWDYFQLHATQRLTTFNFYVGISSLLVGGLAATIKGDLEIPLLGGVVGALLIVFSLVFRKLDQRNSDLIKGAERALMYFEAKSGLPDQEGKPHEAKRFTREDFDTSQKKKEWTWRVWRNHYSYSDCFSAVFLIFGGLGVIGLSYAAIRHWPW